MPVTFMDRLPLPNLKVYTTTSVVLLSMSFYIAMTVSSELRERLNVTMAEADPGGGGGGGGGPAGATVDGMQPLQLVPGTLPLQDNAIVKYLDVLSYMMREPFCFWSLVNGGYCAIVLCGAYVQRVVFQKLRVSESQRLKDKFWNYMFYKFIFVFGVLNAQYLEEVLLWTTWFTLLVYLTLGAHLCKDRFDYLSYTPARAGTAGARRRVLALALGTAAAAALLLAASCRLGLRAGPDIFAFMACECLLVLVSACHVAARYVLVYRQAESAGPAVYYTHLFFDVTSLVVETAHVVHMVVYCGALVSLGSLVLLLQLRHLLHKLQARVARHRLYLWVNTHMDRNYPMASKEEVEENGDNCAICWESLKEARKLPCKHLFHHTCLSVWLQQDASCPTCRRALPAPPAPGAPSAAAGALPAGTAAPGALPPRTLPPLLRAPHNATIHFDGSRYLSWLPSFSVEVTRRDPPRASHTDAMATARQVQQLFPQFSLPLLVADLAATRSLDLTVDNILEGRLLAPTPTPAPLDPAPLGTPLEHLSDIMPSTMDSSTQSSDSWLQRHSPPPLLAPPPTPVLPLDVLGPDNMSPSQMDMPMSFSQKSSEREATLQRRKEMMISEARRRYLARSQPPSSAALHPPPAPPAPRDPAPTTPLDDQRAER